MLQRKNGPKMYRIEERTEHQRQTIDSCTHITYFFFFLQRIFIVPVNPLALFLLLLFFFLLLRTVYLTPDSGKLNLSETNCKSRFTCMFKTVSIQTEFYSESVAILIISTLSDFLQWFLSHRYQTLSYCLCIFILTLLIQGGSNMTGTICV